MAKLVLNLRHRHLPLQGVEPLEVIGGCMACAWASAPRRRDRPRMAAHVPENETDGRHSTSKGSS